MNINHDTNLSRAALEFSRETPRMLKGSLLLFAESSKDVLLSIKHLSVSFVRVVFVIMVIITLPLSCFLFGRLFIEDAKRQKKSLDEYRYYRNIGRRNVQNKQKAQ